ncbi:MAG: sulfatase, partial [bacterium]|nr:sulfatase [bacterium]
RTDRWKYIRNLSERCRIDLPTEDPEVDNYLERINTDKPRPWEELYDLQADPLELKNLAADPAHEATLKEMRAKLDGWMTETHDYLRGPYEFITHPALDRRFVGAPPRRPPAQPRKP